MSEPRYTVAGILDKRIGFPDGTMFVPADSYDALAARVARLTAEVMHYTSGTPHPDSQDAARYRWLRDGNRISGSPASWIAEEMNGNDWDAAIDAALSDADSAAHSPK